MLTEEKIKKLKPGDELTHTVYFKSVDDNGYIHCDFDPKYSRFVNTFAVDPGVLTLPKENTILYFPETLFKNITPDEKQQLTSFFHSYYVDKRRKNELRSLLKKVGIDIMKAPCGPDRTFCHVVDTMVKPKFTPTRLFKEGDIVRYVERDGRSYVDAPPVGATCRVIVGEDRVGMVSVEFKFSENEEPAVHDVPFYHLELVTPVEELEPYSVVETMSHDGWQVVRDGLPLAIYDSRRHPHAKAAAETECKRLNEEWRKKVGTEVPCSEDGKEEK